jgi:hypothetical protein
MPDGLTPRATVLLVALAFGLTLCAQALLGGGSSPARPAEAKQNASASIAVEEPASQPDVRLVAAGTVPALREPRKARKRRVRKPKRTARKVVRVAPRTRPAPVVPAATARPAPTAAPRYVPPAAPRYIPPAPRRTPKPAAPKPTPPPASTPPSSGEFDTSGER